MKYFNPILASVILHATIVAQTQVDLRTQSKSVDFTQANSTRPVKTGTAMPATCLAGDLFLDLDAPGGGNLFACLSTNVWVLQGALGTLISVQSEGTTVGSRPILNLLAGQGLVNILDDDGLRLNVQQHVDTALVETRQGMQIGATLLCSSNSASSTTYACGMNPQLAQYSTGMMVHWKPDVAGLGGGTTLNIDGLGAKGVKLADGDTDPSPIDIQAGALYTLWYDGTHFRLPAPAVGMAATGNTRPVCSMMLQGRFWYTAGMGGLKDEVAVCAKDASDVLDWRVVY